MNIVRLVASTILVALACTAAIAPAAAVEAAGPADCAATSTPNQKMDEDTIRRIEQAWLTAEYQGDSHFLECLLEPDYRTSGRNGKVRTRSDLLERVAKTTPTTVEIPKLEIIAIVHGDVASAHSILRKTDKDGTPKEVHFVDTYTFHDGRWHAFSGADL